MRARALWGLAAAAVAAVLWVGLRGQAPESGRPAPEGPEAPAVDGAAPAALPPMAESPPPPTPGGAADLTALVVDEAGAPVPGATVTTAADGVPAAARSAETGPDGRAAFPGLPAGVKVSVNATGGRTRIPATEVADLADGRPAEVRLVLKEGGAVSGTVLGRGAPVTGAYTVTLVPEAPGSAPWSVRVGRGGQMSVSASPVASRRFPAGTAVFGIDGVPAGKYLARASAEGYVEGESEPFEVVAGAITDGVTIPLDPGGRITGLVVRTLTGEPVAGAEIAASMSGGLEGDLRLVNRRRSGFRMLTPGDRSAKSDPQGRFVLDGLPPGTYSVTASAQDLASTEADGIEVRENAEVSGVLLSLGEGGTITGTIYGPDGQPVPGGEVLIAPVQKHVRIYGDFGDRVKADENGVYVAEHLEPGTWQVRRPQSSQGATVVSMSMTMVAGGRQAPEEDEEEEPEPGTVVVREGQVTRYDVRDEQTAAIRGKVLDGAGQAVNEQVTLVEVPDPAVPAAAAGPRPAVPRFAMPRFAQSDLKGEFEFTGLAPGRYRIACAGAEQEIDLAAGETRAVTLRASAARVEGVVLDAEGKPVEGAMVYPERVEDRPDGIPAFFGTFTGRNRTGADGAFALEGLAAPGRYRVRVQTDRGEGRSEVIVVEAGQTVKDVRVVLEPQTRLVVEVRDAAGAPVAGAFVTLRRDDDSRATMGGQTDEKGIARLRAAPGAYVLMVLRADAVRGERDPAPREIPVTVDARDGDQQVSVTLD